MNRRSLLGFLFAAPIAGPAIVKEALAAQPAVQGFGLAALKEEGATLAYEGGVLTRPAFATALWPAIREWWGREYAQHADEYGDIFDSPK